MRLWISIGYAFHAVDGLCNTVIPHIGWMRYQHHISLICSFLSGISCKESNFGQTGKSVVRQCAILDGVKIQVDLKMKGTGSGSCPESDSVE